MPAFKPTSQLDALDYITRNAAGGDYPPGWEVSLTFGVKTHTKRFSDKGDAPAALARAIEWRDEKVRRINAQAGQALSSGEGGTGLGVRITTTTTGGITYDVVAAELPASGSHGKKRTVRSINKHGLDGALRQAAQFRFDGMRERYGDEYPFQSVEELVQAVHDVEAEPA